MLIYTKNLKGDKTEIVVEPTDTVLSIKEKIRDAQGHPVDLQKLILAGKILDDSKTCAESGIVENSTLVLMVSKPKPDSKPPQSNPPSSAPPQPAVVPPPPSNPAPVNVVPSNPVPAPASNPSQIEGPDALVTGEQLSSTISMICDMGFDRKDVEAAMKAAFNNPDRAIEYLTTGIPQARNPEPAGSSAEQFRQMMQDPQFMQIIQVIQQNPAALGPILQQLQQNNPDLYRVLANNREELMQALQGGGAGNSPQSRITPGLVGGLPRPPPGATAIQLTAEEQQHLKQLMELGYNQQTALEAYLSCDKNFEWAANYLLENYPPGGGWQEEVDDEGN